MSHFTVMVIGKDWEAALKPFQENNMGDCPKEYLTFYDTEDEYRQKYDNEGVERVVMPDGRLLLTWDDEFKKLGKSGFGSDTHEVPADLPKKKVPFKETYTTFEEFVADWCGHASRDEEKSRYGYWENPNRKWDWYQMGGRWTGYFRLKQKFFLPPTTGTVLGESGLTAGDIMALVNLRKVSLDKYKAVLLKYKGKEDKISEQVEQFSSLIAGDFQPGVKGQSGLMGSNSHEGAGFADSARKGDVDVEYMRLEAEANARQKYQKVAAVFPDKIIPKIKTWKEFLDELPKDGDEIANRYIDRARKLYHAQEAVQRCVAVSPFDFFEKLDDYQVSEEEYVKTARDAAITTFAIIKDGKWYEKGGMGWWGCVANEKEQAHWNEEFAKLFDSIPDDEIVTVVDCHI